MNAGFLFFWRASFFLKCIISHKKTWNNKNIYRRIGWKYKFYTIIKLASGLKPYDFIEYTKAISLTSCLQYSIYKNKNLWLEKKLIEFLGECSKSYHIGIFHKNVRLSPLTSLLNMQNHSVNAFLFNFFYFKYLHFKIIWKEVPYSFTSIQLLLGRMRTITTTTTTKTNWFSLMFEQL